MFFGRRQAKQGGWGGGGAQPSQFANLANPSRLIFLILYPYFDSPHMSHVNIYIYICIYICIYIYIYLFLLSLLLERKWLSPSCVLAKTFFVHVFAVSQSGKFSLRKTGDWGGAASPIETFQILHDQLYISFAFNPPEVFSCDSLLTTRKTKPQNGTR